MSKSSHPVRGPWQTTGRRNLERTSVVGVNRVVRCPLILKHTLYSGVFAFYQRFDFVINLKLHWRAA